MPTYGFSLQSPRDMLEKAKRELSRLESSSSFCESDTTSQVDHAFNLAITLWHIVEWLWHSTGAQEQAMRTQLGFAKFEDLHSYVRHQCVSLDVCYEIATGSKHFRFTGKTVQTRMVTDTRVSAGPTETIAGLPVNVLKITVAPGNDMRAVEVFKEALLYRDQFFLAHHL